MTRMHRQQIRRLSISGFRGSRYPVSFDFSSNYSSMLIYGANAKGKSTVADAVEWFFTGYIEELRKEGCGRIDYRHRLLDASEDAVVEFEFEDSELNSKIALSSAPSQVYSNESDEFKSYLDSSKDELLILRHKDLKSFVDVSKSRKREEIAELIGMQDWERIRADIGYVANRLIQQLEEKRKRRLDRQQEVADLIGSDYSEEAAWKFAQSQAKFIAIDTKIDSRKSLTAANELAKAASGDSDRTTELAKLTSAEKVLNGYSDKPLMLDSVGIYIEQFNEFCADPNKVLWQKLRELFEQGREIIESGDWTQDICPLCGRPSTREEIFSHIKEHDDSTEAVQEETDQLASLEAAALRDLNHAEKSVKAISEIDLEETKVLQSGIGDTSASLAGAKALMSKQVKANRILNLEEINLFKNIGIFTKSVAKSSKSVSAKLAAMAPSDAEKSRIEAYQYLGNLVGHFDALSVLEKDIDPIEIQSNSVTVLNSAFEELRRETMGKILDIVSADVSRYYLRLHPNEGFDDIRLRFLPEEDGVEFHIYYKGEEITPPRKFLSESYQSGLGVCLFLATVRAFNSRNGFVVLDDVVNSFDMEHRSDLAHLLIEEFSENQLIVLTHDEVWFEFLRRLAQSGWVHKRIVGWSYEGGIDIEQAPPDDRAECVAALESGDVARAAPRVRMYLERRLKKISNKLGVRMRFRPGTSNEMRTAGELLSDLRRYLDRKDFFDLKDGDVFAKLAASVFVVNYGSHDQSVESAGLSIGDVRFALDRLDELEVLLVCDKCSTPLWHIVEVSFEMQCQCGYLQI